MIRIRVTTFPGTLDDQDAARVVRLVDGEPIALRHKGSELHRASAVIILGGSLYGDYPRCGVIAATVPTMEGIIEQAGKGMLIFDTCNGFQALCGVHLLSGVLIRNDHQRFLCCNQVLHIENSDTIWTKSFTRDDLITVLLENGEGNFQASPKEPECLEGEGRVVFRYIEGNPNGSAKDIAGVMNDASSVAGFTSHPECVIKFGSGPLSADASGTHSDHRDTQGLGIFQSVLANFLR